MEIGLQDKNTYQQTSSIVLLQIPSRDELEVELKKIQSIGITCASFTEPYDDMGLTAFATMPVTEEKRHLFKPYTLWGRSIKGINNPIADFIKQQMKEAHTKKSLSPSF